jgi:hypothetical protein
LEFCHVISDAYRESLSHDRAGENGLPASSTAASDLSE